MSDIVIKAVGARHEAQARLRQDKGRRIRVGDPMSPVMPGDPSPKGGFYRGGQYSPHIDDLAVASFSSAINAGILPSGLPIFDDSGNVDRNKLNDWSPNNEGIPVSFNDDIPVYSSAIVASAFKVIDDSLLSNLNMSVMVAPRTPGDFGNYLIAAKTMSENRQFFSTIYIYPDFYKFVDKPIVAKNPKRTSGISVSTFLTFHAVGHILMSKLTFDGNIKQISDFLDSGKWKKVPNASHTKASFMGRKSTSAWYKDMNHRFLSELSGYSPLDDFAQAFAFYYTSNDYFKKIDPKKYDVMNKIISEQV